MYVLLLLLLIILSYFVIIIGFSTLATFNLDKDYENYIHLRSLTYSGIWLAFQWIKNNPMSPLSQTTKSLPLGTINYQVSIFNTTTRIINVTSTLSFDLQTYMIYTGTATINTSTGDIISIEGQIK